MIPAPDSGEEAWPIGPEAHERAQRKRQGDLPLPVKIAWLEEAQRIAEHLQKSRRELEQRATKEQTTSQPEPE